MRRHSFTKKDYSTKRYYNNSGITALNRRWDECDIRGWKGLGVIAEDAFGRTSYGGRISMKLICVCAVSFIFIIVFSGLCQGILNSQNLEKVWIDKGNSQLSTGFLESSRKQCEKAAQSYQFAINDNSASADLWRAKSLGLFAAKKYRDADTSIDKAIDIDPHSAPSWGVKSLILFSEDRLNESLLCIDNAIELNSSEASFWVTKGLILSEMKRYEDSFDCFDNATRIDPSFAPGWLLKGMMYDILKRYDEALNCYNTAIRSDPLYAPAWFYKGNMLASEERYDEAKDCWTKAIYLNPKYKVLEEEMAIFPTVSRTKLVIQSIYVDPATRDILENVDFIITNKVLSCTECKVTGKQECKIVSLEPGMILSPGQRGPVTGYDMFEDIKRQIEDSPDSLCTAPDFTTKVLFRNCFTVCAATSCSSQGTETLSCQECEGINTDVAVYANNGIIVGLAIRFHPNFWGDIQGLIGQAADESWMGWLDTPEYYCCGSGCPPGSICNE